MQLVIISVWRMTTFFTLSNGGDVMKWYYPKDMWVVKVGKERNVWKAPQELMEWMYQNDMIDEYIMLKVAKPGE